MIKFLFVCVFMSLNIILLAGCAGEVSQIETEPTLPLATSAPTQAAVLQSQTETVPVAAISTAEPDPISTPTLEPSATDIPPITPNMPMLLQPNASTVPVVCKQVKSYINIQLETSNDSRWLMDFVFEEENVLTFLMWSSRPYPGPTPTPFVGPIEGGGVPVGELSRSRRVLLKGQTWDFNRGILVESAVTDQDAIQSPCEPDCSLEVIGVSPDNGWQLLQITEAPADYQGLWLANKETVINLVPYVPVYSYWQWSNDSHMLWLIYSLQDINGETYGSESMVVDLTLPATPQIVFRSWDGNPYQLQSPPNLLSPDEYDLVFSPEDKTVLLYKNIGSSSHIPSDGQLDVYVFDVTKNPPQLLSTYEAHFPFILDWSTILQDIVILEIASTGAVVYTLNDDVVYEIPVEIIKQMPQLFSVDGRVKADFSNEEIIMRLFLNLDRVAISPDLKQIVLMNEREAWVFSCSD